MSGTAYVLKLLAGELGAPVARKVLDSLGRGKPSTEKLDKAAQSMRDGMGAISALRESFGDDLLRAITDAVERSSGWTQEAGVTDYIRLPTAGRSAFPVLREELNVNLERVAKASGSKQDTKNYFLGVLSVWKDRYGELLGHDQDSKQTFAAIAELLSGGKKSFKDAFRLLSGTGLGTVGALLVIKAVLVATSTGVGVVAMITVFLAGVPFGQVIALTVGATLLGALSWIALTSENAMSTAIAAAYKLLERQEEMRRNAPAVQQAGEGQTTAQT
jgi:hypothetical protein